APARPPAARGARRGGGRRLPPRGLRATSPDPAPGVRAPADSRSPTVRGPPPGGSPDPTGWPPAADGAAARSRTPTPGAHRLRCPCRELLSGSGLPAPPPATVPAPPDAADPPRRRRRAT